MRTAPRWGAALLLGLLGAEAPAAPPPACQALAERSLPPESQPSPEEQDRWTGCDPLSLYYGLGGAPDLEAARRCAWVQRLERPQELLGAHAALMMIYANGAGVERDLALAARLACESPLSEGELELRLRRLREPAPGAPPLQACDGALSGALLAACAELEGELAAPARAARRAALVERLSPAQRQALVAVEQAAAPYHQARLAHEIDRGGTAWQARGIREAQRLEEGLLLALERSPGPPPLPGQDLDGWDQQLNELYRALRRARPGEAEALRQTQRAWLALREAWSAWGEALQPGSGPGWAAWATAERVELLRALLEEEPVP